MAFTGGGDVIGEATVQITPELDMAALQTAVQRMTAEFNRFSRSIGLGPATNQVNQLTAATQRASRSAAEARAQFVEMAIGLEVAGRSLTQFVTVPLTRFLRSSVLEASHFNEIVQQTGVILGENADAAVAWAEDLEASFGLTNSEALETHNNFALLFNEIGVGMEQSAEIAKELATRIGDLASFKDMPIEQVIQRVQSGLVGETEAVRRLGIILDESVIKQKAYEQGIVETGEALSTQQKFLLRAQQILSQTSEAQGDAARTANTFAGQMREMRANTADLREELGNAFLPAITSLITQVNNLLAPLTGLARSFSEMDGPIQEIVLAFLALVAVAGPLATASGRLLVIFRTISGIKLAERLRGIAAQMAAANVATRALQVGLTGVARALPFIGAGIAIFSLVSAYINRTKDDTVSLDDAITNLKNNMLDAPRASAAEFLGISPTQLSTITEELAFLNAELFTQARLQKQALDRGRGTGGRLSIDLPGLSSASNLEIAQKRRDDLQKRINEGVKDFTELVKQGDTALAQHIVTQVTDNRLKSQLTGILNDGIRAQRQAIIIGQQQDAINEALAKSTQSAADAEKDHLEVLKDIASELKARAGLEKQRLQAIQAVTDAQKALKEANEGVAEAQAEYNQLVSEGVIDLEALARAEDNYADALERVVDAEAALLEAQEKASPEDLQEGLDNITKAEIAYRQVLRDNEQAVADLNDELEKNNKITRISLNLAGLSLDQMKGVAANARASAEALSQKASLTEDDNEVVKTAAELQDEAILRGIAEREGLRNINDAKADYVTLTQKGTDADEDVIAAREHLTEVTEDLAEAEEERRLAGQPDQARIEAIADAHERVADAIERAAEASAGLRTAEQERITTLQEIRIELGFLNEDERAINRALIDRYGINEDLAEQQRRFARETAARTASSALNSLDFDNIGVLGRGLAKAAFLSPAMLNLLTQHLIASPGAPIRALLKRIGVPDSLLTGFKDGGVVTRPMVANIGEGYKAEAVVPLTNARNAIAALQKGWGYMAPQLKTALAPALAPRLTQQAQPGFSMTHGSYSRRATPELAALHAIASKLENQGTVTHIEAPIQINSKSDELQARKLRRELQKLQSANRGRPDARMR